MKLRILFAVALAAIVLGYHHETLGQIITTLTPSGPDQTCGNNDGTFTCSPCGGPIVGWEEGSFTAPSGPIYFTGKDQSTNGPDQTFVPTYTGVQPPSSSFPYHVVANPATKYGKTAYRAIYTTDGGLTTKKSWPIEIIADARPSVAGTLTATAPALNESGSGYLQLSGSLGTKIEIVTLFSNATVVNAGSSGYGYNLTKPATFYAKVSNGICQPAASNEVTIEVFKTGLLSGSSYVVEDDRVSLTVTDFYKTIVRWEYSINGGATWVNFDYGSYGKTITGDRIADTHQLTTNTKFRALIDKGPFGQQYTNILDVPYYSYSQFNTNPVNGNNYVREQQVTTRGITNPNEVDALTPDQKHEAITYLDGKGRTIQQNMRSASPAKKDIISVGVYDNRDMQSTKYLPYVSTFNDGNYRVNPLSEQATFYTNGTADKISDSSYPMATTIIESSALGRIKEQGSVGQEFQPGGGHTKMVVYSNNIANDVRLFLSDGTSPGYYAPNQLSSVTVTDEDQKQTQTFTNGMGQTILTRVLLNSNINQIAVPWLETYTIYDNSGHVLYIISPKGTAALSTNGWVLTQSIKDQYAHQFVYDIRGRLVEKKVPGQLWAYYCYDQLDRLVLTQDGNTRSANQWLFVKYDRKGRAVMQGLYANTLYTTRATLQLNVVDPLYALDTDPYYEERGSAAHGYTNQSFPTSGIQVHTVNYYDDYDLNNDGNPDVAYTQQSLTDENTPTLVTVGMPTASKRLVLDGGTTWLYNYAFYDVDGHTIQTLSNNHLSTALDNLNTMVYDFEGKVKLTKNYHNAGAGHVTTVINRYNYDHTGRVTQIYQNNNAASTDQLVAQYEYNELGQLVDKKLHDTGGTAFLQSIDYRYNIQGKLTSINNAQLTSDATLNDDTNDMFGMELLYQNSETGLNTGIKETYYNGNISAVKWKGAGASAGATDQKSYKFSYDNSNKFIKATSQLYNGNTWTKEAGVLNESMTYDHNGNIIALQRNQRKNLSLYTYTAESIDSLTYAYDPAMGDQLLQVTDAARGRAAAGFNNGNSGTANDYVYDSNGNVIKDLNKGISNIVYNYLGKPATITFADHRHIDYLYDVTGAKLTMKTYDTLNVLKTTTDYVNGFVYENNILSFFSSPEGRVVNNNGSLEHQYSILDNQGNTRVVFSSVNPTTAPITATFEDPTADIQKGFRNIPPNTMYWVPKSAANNTSSGQYVMRMNNTYSTGPAKSVSVFPGDVLNLEVWSYFEGGSGFGASNQPLNTLITSVAGAFGGAPGAGEAGRIYSHVSNAYNIFGSPTNAGDGAPTAHLNYILFDRDYNPIDMGWKAVPTTANMSKQLVAFNPITIKEAGFMYVYLSYGGDGTNWVYFDDLKITQTKTNVIQYNEYYPYGLQANTSWTRDNTTGNNFLGNGGTEINVTTGWYDLLRNYDPTLGRFMQVDERATQYASLGGYHYSYNNPVMFNDPSGAGPEDPDHRPTSGSTLDNIWEETMGGVIKWYEALTREWEELEAAKNGDADAAVAYANRHGDAKALVATGGWFFSAREDADGNEIAGSREFMGYEYEERQITSFKSDGDPKNAGVPWYVPAPIFIDIGKAIGVISRTISGVSIGLLTFVMVRDQEIQRPRMVLGTIPPNIYNPYGHSIIGIGYKNIAYFHLDGTSPAKFTAVSPLQLEKFEARGMTLVSRNITELQLAGSMAVITSKVAGPQCDWNGYSNSCVTQTKEVMLGAGIVAPPTIVRPSSLEIWFRGQ